MLRCLRRSSKCTFLLFFCLLLFLCKPQACGLRAKKKRFPQNVRFPIRRAIFFSQTRGSNVSNLKFQTWFKFSNEIQIWGSAPPNLDLVWTAFENLNWNHLNRAFEKKIRAPDLKSDVSRKNGFFFARKPHAYGLHKKK